MITTNQSFFVHRIVFVPNFNYLAIVLMISHHPQQMIRSLFIQICSIRNSVRWGTSLREVMCLISYRSREQNISSIP